MIKPKAGQPKAKGAGGRKSKLTPELIKKAYELTKQGANQKELAAALGIDVTTVCDYQNRYPQFSKALKRGREFANQCVVGSLFKSACGYDVNFVRRKYLTHTKGKDKGKKYLAEEIHETRHFAPNSTSMALYLNNLMPETFSRKEEDRAGRLAEVNFYMTVVNADGTKTPIPWPELAQKIRSKGQSLPLPPLPAESL